VKVLKSFSGPQLVLLGVTAGTTLASVLLTWNMTRLQRDIAVLCHPYLSRQGWQKVVTAMADGSDPESYLEREETCAKYGQVQYPSGQEY